MAKCIAILYFSGTGNTEAVARMIRDELAPGIVKSFGKRLPAGSAGVFLFMT